MEGNKARPRRRHRDAPPTSPHRGSSTREAVMRIVDDHGSAGCRPAVRTRSTHSRHHGRSYPDQEDPAGMTRPERKLPLPPARWAPGTAKSRSGPPCPSSSQLSGLGDDGRHPLRPQPPARLDRRSIGAARKRPQGPFHKRSRGRAAHVGAAALCWTARRCRAATTRLPDVSRFALQTERPRTVRAARLERRDTPDRPDRAGRVRLLRSETADGSGPNDRRHRTADANRHTSKRRGDDETHLSAEHPPAQA